VGIKSQTFYRQDLENWKSYFQQLPEDLKGIYHSPEYMIFLESVGFGKAVCQIFSQDDHFVYFPALLRELPFGADGYDSISSWYYGGPLTNLPDGQPLTKRWCDALIDGRKQLNIICEFIRFDPNLKNHMLMKAPYIVEPNRATVFVDLRCSWDDIVSGFSSQNRRNVKQAQKKRVNVQIDITHSAWQRFAEIYQMEMIRKNAPRHLRFKNQFFLELSKAKGITLFIVNFENEIIGGFIAAHAANVAHHYLSAVQYDHWEKRPNNLLFTEVIRHFHSKGYRKFDFQGGRKGVYRFKTNFSKSRGHFYAASCIYHPKRFDTLNRQSGKRNKEYFPPYRSPI
jgi:hypothetical protein